MNLRLSTVFKITIIFFCFCLYTNAQVGIGTTTPNPSSILEIESSTQGLLIPRVELTSTNDVSTITSGNVESLLVYNTQTINNVEPGYYYWDSSEWVRVAAGSNVDNQKITNFSVIGSNLSITLENGNTASVPLADIIGNTDSNIANTNLTLDANRTLTTGNYDLNIDANTLVIDGSANEVGIGVSNPTAKLDVNGTARIRTVDNGAATDNILTRDSSGNIRRRTAAEIVAAGGGNNDNIYATNGTITGNRYVNQGNYDLNFDSSTLVIDGSDNEVGIGINNPSAKLDVNGDARIRLVNIGADTDYVLTRDSSGNIRRRSAAQIVTAGGGNDDNIYATNGTITSNRFVNQGNFDLNFDSNTLVIDGSANEVGIGINSPTAKLDINGDVRIRTVNNGADTDNILTRDASGNIRRRTAAQIVAAGGGSDDNIYSTNGTITANRYVSQGNYDLNFDSNTLVIDGSANEVGIGINSPTAKLDVNGDVRIRTVNNGADTDNILTRDASGNIRRRTAAQIVAAGGGSDDNIYSTSGTITGNRNITQNNYDVNFDANTLVIDGSANEVGIGINNPTAKLDVNGTARIRTVNIGASTDNILTRDASGNIRRRTAAEIVAAGGGSDDNIYSTSGTITGNRNITQNNYDINFDANTLVIDGSANNVGIGTTYPNIDLAIGDTDTGLQQQGDGNLAIYTNNNERIRINSSGNVGVGTTTPTERFHVNGNSRLGSNIARDGDFRLNEMGTGNRNSRIQFFTDADASNDAEIFRNNGSDGDFIIDNEGNGIMYLRNRGSGQVRLGTNNTDDLYIEDGGNVGIGISDPTAKLDVNGTARIRTVNNGDDSDNILTRDASGNIRRRTAAQIVTAAGISNITASNGLSKSGNDVRLGGTITTNTNVLISGTNNLNFDSNTLVVDGGSNNVGVGLNNPTAKLDVNGTARIRTVNIGAATDNILTRDASGNIRRRTAAEIVAAGGGSDDNIYSTSGTITGNRNITQNNYDINFDANTLVIDGSANNVGIGTTYPNIDLAIGDTDTGLQQQGDGNLAIYTNNNERIRINSSGNVGVGTTTPTERFHVNGNSRLGSNIARDGDIRLNEMGTGNRNSRIQFFTDADASNDAEIFRNNGSDGDFIIDNEGNGIMYLRNRGSGQVRLGTNNTDDLYIEDGGNVGIGISDPTAKLDVNGTARIRTVNNGDDSDNILTRDASGNIRRRTAAQIVTAAGISNITASNGLSKSGNDVRLGGTITTNTNVLISGTNDLNFDSNTLVVDGGSNNVGVGLNNPTAKIDINGTARIRTVNIGAATDNILTRDTSGNIRRRTAAEIVTAAGISNITTSNGLSKSGNDVRLGGTITTNTNVLISGTNDLNFDSNTLVVDGGSNNVGVGLNNPTAKLDVNGTARIRTVNIGAATDNILTRDASGNIRRRTAAEIVAAGGGSDDNIYSTSGTITGNRNITQNNYDINFDANTLVIDGSANNVGIGTTYPNIDLAIGDTDTGLQQQGDGNLAIYTNNNERIRINSSGNVGVGTTTPTERFHVNGNSRLGSNIARDGDIRLNEMGTGNRNSRIQFFTDADASNDAEIFRNNGSDGDFIIDNEGNGIMYLRNRGSGQVRLGTNNTDDLYIEDGGNVGIGISDPTAKLDVNGTARIRTVNNGDATDNILTRDSSGNIRKRTAAEIVAAGGGNEDNIYYTNGTLTSNRIVNLNTNTIDFSGSANDAFQVDGSTFTIDADTNRIGIGMSDPEERLNVLNGIIQVGRASSTHAQIETNRIEAGKNTGSVALTVNDSGGNANITFNNTDRIPDINGNAARISVNVDSSTNAAMSFEIAEGVTAGTAVTTSTEMTLTTTGLGIGTTGPSEKLDIDGTARVRDLSNSQNRIVYADSQGVLNIRSTRSATFARGTSANYNSSDDWRRITSLSSALDVRNGDVILVNWSTIVKLTGASTTDTLNFEVRLTGSGGCSDISLSGGDFSEINHDDFKGYHGTSGANSSCEGTYTISLWGRNLGSDSWSYKESNVTATVN
ncbi:hypothetical protein VDP25_02950 [Winogradskyella sp. ECml5-4]|uniref:beta strand repeat-containing protein n=1 Tax=Winogradskyella sp. ECml5-4 TaxID=3110975 RepID=UPI002FF1048D